MAAIGDLIEFVQVLLSLYKSTETQCDFTPAFTFGGRDQSGIHKRQCDAMMLGMLEKIAIDAVMESAPASAGYDGLAFDSFLRNDLGVFLSLIVRSSQCFW